MMENKTRGFVAALSAAALMGSLGLFVRNVSSGGITITFTRLGVGFALLGSYLVLRGQIRTIEVKLSRSLVLSGIFLAGCAVLYIEAIKTIPLASAVFLLYIAPLLATGLASVYLKEKLTRLNAGLILLAFGGCLFIFELNVPFSRTGALGYLYGVASAFLYALFIVANRAIACDIPLLARAFWQMLFGVIATAPFIALEEKFFASDLYWLVAIGILHGFAALMLMIASLRFLEAYEYGTIAYFEAIVATLLGFWVYGESISKLQAVGCALILFAGLAQVYAAKKPAGG